jgi:hypothetical protein
MSKEAQEILERSGNTFHFRVANYLKQKGWENRISPYYLDNISNKPREIDLIAEKSWPTHDDFNINACGTINIKLFIECKYLASKTTVFWFAPKDNRASIELALKVGHLRPQHPALGDYHYTSRHESVAILFETTGGGPNNLERDPFYKALNQSLHAISALRNEGSIIRPQTNQQRLPRIVINPQHPVIICNSFKNLFKVDSASPTTFEKIIDSYFQLEVNYCHVKTDGRKVSEYFLIDIVDFSKIDDYLAVLDKNILAITSGNDL